MTITIRCMLCHRRDATLLYVHQYGFIACTECNDKANEKLISLYADSDLISSAIAKMLKLAHVPPHKRYYT